MNARARTCAVLLAGLFVMSPLALPANAQTAAPVVTPAEARQIARDYDAANNKASNSLDFDFIQQFDTGWVRKVGAASYNAALGRGQIWLNDGKNTNHLTDVDVYLARQTTYPASFVASMSYGFDSGTLRSLAVFEKQSATRNWQVGLATFVDDSVELPDVPLDSEGYAQPVPPSQYGSLRADPSGIGYEVSSYLNLYADEGDPPPTSFGDAPWVAEELKAERDDVGGISPDRATANFQVDSRRTDYPVYRTSDGGALAFFIYGDLFSANAYGSLFWSEDNKYSQFRGLLPIGNYHSFQIQRLHMDAAAIPRYGSDQPVSRVARGAWITDAVGKPVDNYGASPVSKSPVFKIESINPAEGSLVPAAGATVEVQASYQANPYQLAWFQIEDQTRPSDDPNVLSSTLENYFKRSSGTEVKKVTLDDIPDSSSSVKVGVWLVYDRQLTPLGEGDSHRVGQDVTYTVVH